MVATHSIRPLLRWLPFQFGKGKLAHYLLQPTARIRDVVKPGFRSKLRLLLGAAGYASRHQGVCTRV